MENEETTTPTSTEDVNDTTPEQPAKRRGRPPGSKNRPKTVPAAPVEKAEASDDSDVITTFPADEVNLEPPSDLVGFFQGLCKLMQDWNTSTPIKYDFECRRDVISLVSQHQHAE